MYTGNNYPLKDMLRWTRSDIYIFITLAILPVVLYSLLGLKWLHLPWLPIALIGTAVAFVVSFKNNSSYGRMWEARKIWGGIVNASRAFTILVRDTISNENNSSFADEKIIQIRREIINRHIAWMTVHRYALRKNKSWENSLSRGSNKEYADHYQILEWTVSEKEALANLLSESELSALSNKRSAATQIMAMQSKHLTQLKKDGLLWEFSWIELEKYIAELVSLQGKNERIKNFPYPRQFATLNYFFVWIFILLLPFGIMTEFEKIGQGLLKSIPENYNIQM